MHAGRPLCTYWSTGPERCVERGRGRESERETHSVDVRDLGRTRLSPCPVLWPCSPRSDFPAISPSATRRRRYMRQRFQTREALTTLLALAAKSWWTTFCHCRVEREGISARGEKGSITDLSLLSWNTTEGKCARCTHSIYIWIDRWAHLANSLFSWIKFLRVFLSL